MNTFSIFNSTSLVCRAALSLCGFLPALGFALQPIEHVRLDDRLEVYWVLDHALPMVDIQVDFDAGSRFDPARLTGLSGATAQMLSKGVRGESAPDKGPAKGQRWQPLDENALGQAWADLGAIFVASSSDDRLSVRMRSLVKTDILDKAVELASREIGTPAFDATIWRRERAMSVSSIEESLTQPAPVAAKLFRENVFGTHPYGQSVTVASVKAIETQDLQRFHQRFFTPCRARVSMVGDLQRADVERIARTLLSRLPKAQSCAALAPLPTLPAVQALGKGKTVALAFAASQAHVLMGQPGIARDDARYFPLTVGNYILGGRASGTALCLGLLALLMGLTWRQSRSYADIESLYLTTIERNPECWMAHNNLGNALFARGDFDDAIYHYRRALEIKPDYAEPHSNLGNIAADRGHLDEAIDCYRQSLAIAPDYAEAHNNLGNALARRGNLDEAIIHFRKALQGRKDFVGAYYNLGNALASRQQFDEAIRNYQKAVDLSPDDAEAHNNLGLALVGSGQLAAAITHYRTALDIQPVWAQAHNNLANALAWRGQFDEAIAHYRRALEISPDNPEARRNLDLVLAERERIRSKP